MGVIQDRIRVKLREALRPTALDVLDESDQHAGHSGWREAGETHFRVKVASPAFVGKSRVDRHRMVHGLLADELKGGVHALAIEARAPNEPSRE